MDTSTTSSKALIIDERGEVIAVASSPHTYRPPSRYGPGRDPLEWWGLYRQYPLRVGKSRHQRNQIAAFRLPVKCGLVLLNDTQKYTSSRDLWNPSAYTSQCDGHQQVGKRKIHSDHGQCRIGRIYLRQNFMGENRTRIYRSQARASAKRLYTLQTHRRICDG
ncbi:MAG: hypothetical protein IPO36_07120 [Anaerolineales bacterium]|nr:hypothetical protein [Anaerolineales bacterium]